MLLAKGDQDSYWILSGGKVELFEDTRTTLKRGLLEKTGHEAQVQNLRWFVESFSDLDATDHHAPSFDGSV